MRIDLTGQRFGRLTVVGVHDIRNQQVRWLCRCDCGGEAIANSAHLRSGHTRSCGCIRREMTACLNQSHGMSRKPEYRVWTEMRRRCSIPTHKDYKYYGARGIGVCPEWQQSFVAFYDHVSKLPHFGEAGRSLDRINNNSNYEPGNVRWATATEQAHNRRRRISA